MSKGRYDKKLSLTANFLIKDNVDFKIAVEPQEYDLYCNNVGEDKVLELPFSNLGLGSFPSRNYCWEDSIKNGFKKHWLFDDNIRCISRLNKGLRTKCNSLFALENIENFIDRYENVAIGGMNYRYFVTKETKKPYVINAHVYSGMLIQNNIPFRWRLKYNEDVDLCLQVLHHGYFSTVLFNAFLIDKTSTAVKMKGGNQDELYKNNAYEKKVLKAKSLESVWPQYAKTVMRFNRPHHFVDWKRHFQQPLIRILTNA